MKDYVITTDTNADLPNYYIEENEIGILSLSYTIDGVTYDKDHELPYEEFYSKMRNGSMPTTSQVNPQAAKTIFENIINEKNVDILHIAFSSGLSGSYNSARLAAEEVMDENSNSKIIVIDSLSASLGQGLLVHKALEHKKQGRTIEETTDWIKANIRHICHNFTVDDLQHLYRGGRVSKVQAVLGTMANVKPILYVNDEGHLVPSGKVRGRKKSLITLVDSMEKQIGSYQDKNDIVFISHGDAEEDAQYVADMVRERFGISSFLINYVGPSIGAHSGPGTIALFYMGESR
ncbi:DegV family protein [Anaerosacchariphilus polymeriproducens]|uniref:DegV family protein n=1 Tax=Anaerosacchariphilus polymeriproducens TaxID=1812858 RepID=A0A371AZC4_9FIRM|nr:DegV family protein [Anaerosacchariphilus polymeriproducens]RDU24830.1 DegV family protein [Anaerosacchariphilus polymeriproducens]